jgi:hypothetical protein
MPTPFLVRYDLDNVSPARYVWDAGGNGLPPSGERGPSCQCQRTVPAERTPSPQHRNAGCAGGLEVRPCPAPDCAAVFSGPSAPTRT